MLEFGSRRAAVPYVRNYFKNERLYPRLRGSSRALIPQERIDLVHGQHVMPACRPSRPRSAADIPAVCTVRDYWPVCYWSDLIHTRASASLCPGCSRA